MVIRNLSKKRSQRKRSSKRKSQRKRRQRGGRVTMPSEYFGVNSGRYFPKGSPQLAVPNSAYGVNKATSRGADIGSNMMGPDLGPTRHSGKQTGGRVTMPSEYFGTNSGRYFPEGSPQLAVPNSAYGVNKATSRGADIGNNMMGPDLGPTRHSGKQTGGKKKSQRRKRSQRKKRSQKKKRSQRKRSSKRKQRGGAIRSGSRLPGDQFVKYTQVGSSYRFVTNPKTGRKLDIFGKQGKAILRKFFKEGGMQMPKY